MLLEGSGDVAAPHHPVGSAVFGFAGWSDLERQRLVEKVLEFGRDEVDVATIKRHHNFEADHVGKDSYRHRKAVQASASLIGTKVTHFIEHTAAAEPDCLSP